MKATNIIFLDIDGVMNTHNYMRRQERETGKIVNEEWSPMACRHVKLLCKKFDARIVISSTWRIERDLQELRHILKNNNINPDLLIGTTPILAHEAPDAFCRGDEIERWLDKHDYSDFVIIDDIPASESLEEQQSHLVIVDPDKGLAEKDAVKRAAKILDGNL